LLLQNHANDGTLSGQMAADIVPRRTYSHLVSQDILVHVAMPRLRLDNLISRYEEPSSMVRWDSPLFTVSWSESDVPIELIWKAITEGNVKPPNSGTQAVGDLDSFFFLCFRALLALPRFPKHLLMPFTRWNKFPPKSSVPFWPNKGRLAHRVGVLLLA
jgi:Chromatin associated protein KTI12